MFDMRREMQKVRISNSTEPRRSISEGDTVIGKMSDEAIRLYLMQLEAEKICTHCKNNLAKLSEEYTELVMDESYPHQELKRLCEKVENARKRIDVCDMRFYYLESLFWSYVTLEFFDDTYLLNHPEAIEGETVLDIREGFIAVVIKRPAEFDILFDLPLNSKSNS